MKTLVPTLLATAALALLPAPARAAFVFTLTESGNNVIIAGTGTLNTTALTYRNSANFGAFIDAGEALIYNGDVRPLSVNFYSGVIGPDDFGISTGARIASSGTSPSVGIYGGLGVLVLRGDYVSGSLLSGTNTYNGATFASIGFTPGTYVYTWGTGANADSLTVTSVAPEPSTWALLGVGAGLLAARARRRRTSPV